jgi:triacylglycerol lipase
MGFGGHFTMRTTWDDLRRPGAATDFFARHPMPVFDPTATGFHPGNALWLAEISRIVYRRDVQELNPPPQPARSRFLEDQGLQTLAFFASHEVGAQAMLIHSTGQSTFAVLAFRGTEQTVADYLTDADMGFQTLSRTQVGVHRGFKRAMDALWPEIDAQLAQLSCPVFYTGHSLGAALATLAAARRAPKATYTYGSPRVGNAAFARSVREVPIYRIVHGHDVVTSVPPELMCFQHVGELLHLPREGSEKDLPLSERWEQLTDPPGPMADHAPIHYVDGLAALCRV